MLKLPQFFIVKEKRFSSELQIDYFRAFSRLVVTLEQRNYRHNSAASAVTSVNSALPATGRDELKGKPFV